MTESETITTRAARRRDASIENISWDLLRLIFLREGKIAGRAWPTSAEDTPSAVREHLVNVLSVLSSSLSGLDEELRDSLMSVYFASAKKIWSKDVQHEQQAADLTYEAVRERFRTEVGRHGGDAHWELSEDVRLVVEQIASEPWSPIPQNQITAIYREIGRICGPLLLTMGVDGIPDLPDTATNALSPVIEARVEIDPSSMSSHTNSSFPNSASSRVSEQTNSLQPFERRVSGTTTVETHSPRSPRSQKIAQLRSNGEPIVGPS